MLVNNIFVVQVMLANIAMTFDRMMLGNTISLIGLNRCRVDLVVALVERITN